MNSEAECGIRTIDREIEGLGIRFVSGRLDSKPGVSLGPSDIRSPDGVEALREVLLESIPESDWSRTQVGLPSLRGEWFRAAGALKHLGVTQLVVSIPRRLDERVNAVRNCIPVWTAGLIFLPTRKCGYSSLREYCVQNFEESKRRHEEKGEVSHSLNEEVDFVSADARACFSLSIARNPLRRFSSFYADKLLRDNDSNRRQYFEPFAQFIGDDSLSPRAALDVIEKIPDEFRDPHYRSQSINLFLGDDLLVDMFIPIENLKRDFSSVMRSNGFPTELPHLLSTKHIRKDPAVADMLSDPALAERVLEVYREDFDRLGYEGGTDERPEPPGAELDLDS